MPPPCRSAVARACFLLVFSHLVVAHSEACQADGDGSCGARAKPPPLAERLSLSGRTAVVTGASKGIGAAVALRLAVEGVTQIHLVARDLEGLENHAKLIRDLAPPSKGVVTHAVDLSLPGSAALFFKSFDEAGHSADILVSSAGAIPPGDLLAVDEDTWRKAWDLKVYGGVGMLREFYRRFKARVGRKRPRHGVVVQIMGTGGERPSFNYVAAGSSNSALMNVVKAVGARSRKDGIRVVGVNPGPIMTDRLRMLVEKKMHRTDLGAAVSGPFAAGTVDNIADTVAFLVSDAAEHITGTTITVDGGHTGRAADDSKATVEQFLAYHNWTLDDFPA